MINAERILNKLRGSLVKWTLFPEYGTFEAAPEDVERAELELNRILFEKGIASVGDFYDLIGADVDISPESYTIGWKSDCVMDQTKTGWLYFGHECDKKEGGKFVIVPEVLPCDSITDCCK